MELQELLEGVNPREILFERAERIKSLVRNKINKELQALGDYHKGIPLGTIFGILKKYGIMVIQEDGTEWSGFLTGREGRAEFDVADINSKEDSTNQYTRVFDHVLVMTWYKTENRKDRTYEVITYLS